MDIKYNGITNSGTTFTPVFIYYLISIGDKQTNQTSFFFKKLAGWDVGYCGHYWPIVPALDDR
jgi:hypothetical protein